MAFDNYYPNRKDWLKPYRKSKVFDATCRNHGGCPYCEGNRRYSLQKQLDKANSIKKEQILEEFSKLA